MRVQDDQPLRQFIRGVARRFREDRCFQVASSLTFTTLLALVPLAMLGLTVLSVTPGSSGMIARFDELLAAHVLPESIGRMVMRYFEQIAPQARRLTLIGLGGLAVTALLLMHTIERAFNEIWLVPRRGPTARRVVMYWAVLTAGPILIGASLTITSYVFTMSMGLLGGTPYVEGALVRLASAVVTVAAFTLLYYLVPGRRVELRHALVGGLVAGVLFELAKRGFALYVSRMSNFTMVYGTFAAIPVFLLWVYLSWMLTIFGAIVTAMLPDYGRMRWNGERTQGIAFCEAVEVLKALAEAHATGAVRTLAQISAAAGLPRHRCEVILRELTAREWTGRLAAERWALLCDPAVIRIADIYRLFVAAPEQLSVLATDPNVKAALSRLGPATNAAMDGSLRDLLPARAA